MHTCVDADELKEMSPRYYDDVITDGLKPDHETGINLLFWIRNKYFKYIKQGNILQSLAPTHLPRSF